MDYFVYCKLQSILVTFLNQNQHLNSKKISIFSKLKFSPSKICICADHDFCSAKSKQKNTKAPKISLLYGLATITFYSASANLTMP